VAKRAPAQRHGGRSLRPWLVTVARRIAIDGYRSDAGHPHEVYDHDLDNTASAGGLDDQERIVESVAMNDALRALTHAHREILVETYFNGRTISEAAQKLAIPLGTAKSRVHHALRSLREALAGPRARLRHPEEPEPLLLQAATALTLRDIRHRVPGRSHATADPARSGPARPHPDGTPRDTSMDGAPGHPSPRR
jgi:RNA polymerase sigma factor (sigma-70 family)